MARAASRSAAITSDLETARGGARAAFRPYHHDSPLRRVDDGQASRRSLAQHRGRENDGLLRQAWVHLYSHASLLICNDGALTRRQGRAGRARDERAHERAQERREMMRAHLFLWR